MPSPVARPSDLALAAILIWWTFSDPAAAADLRIGAGWSGWDGDDSAATAAAEGQTDALLAAWGLGLRAGVAATLDLDGDAWVGAGPVLSFDLSELWRIEASLMPGYYERGSGADLGGNVQFRSEVALSRVVSGGLRIGLALTHLSNGGLEDRNPGEDSAFLFASWRL